MNERDLLIDTTPFMPPVGVIEGLSAEDAERRPPNAPHSIAEIVAHMAFWQEWFDRRAQGTGGPMAGHAAEGWPPIEPGSWPALRERFVSGLERLAALGASAGRPLDPPVEYPPLARYTVGDALVHVAMHNAHHLGQVVLLRQQMGLWPPPAGSYTW
jgi:uncharacterized damage-inducible protein DinB